MICLAYKMICVFYSSFRVSSKLDKKSDKDTLEKWEINEMKYRHSYQNDFIYSNKKYLNNDEL